MKWRRATGPTAVSVAVVTGLVAALALTTVGCTQSKVPRDAKILIGATLHDPAGAPASGVPVVLRTEPTGAQVLGGVGLAFATIGMACALDGAPEVCRDNARRASTGDDGGVRFDLTGEDVQDAFGAAQTVSLTAGTPPQGAEVSGPVTTSSFLVQVTDLRLGTLATWRPEVRIGSREPATATVGWSALPSGYAGAVQDYRVIFDDAGGAAVWQQAGGGEVAFDARLLEGTTGGVSVLARTQSEGQDTAVHLDYRSPRQPYSSGLGAPPSRGASCVVQPAPAADGKAQEPRPVTPCPLTDGRFGDQAVSAAPTVIDLGRELPVSLLAVRGCAGSCPVESSVDGQGWAPLAAVAEPFAAIAPQQRPRTRFVRVTGSGLAEVSVWEGDPIPPPAAAPVLAVAPPGTVAVQRADPPQGGSVRRALTVGAIVAVVLLTGIGGFLLGRRRRNAPATLGAQ